MNKNEALAWVLASGITTQSLNQTITFTQYVRTILPLDGFVYWTAGEEVTIKGSLHYVTDRRQNEDETIDVDGVVFTAECEVQNFNQINTNTIYIGCFEGIKFAFRQRQSFFKQAGLYHYVGDAVYPAFEAQLLGNGTPVNLNEAVVSNSLPLWLALNNYVPVYPTFGNSLMLYPSFVVPENLPPPYGVIHIDPAGTSALQAVPYLDATRTHTQLVMDRVRITLYGLQNNAALDFLDCVLQYTVDTQNFGIMNMPVPRDGKRTQSELMAVAMQKVIDFEVDYYQTRANTVAQQLITSALPTFYIEPPTV